MIQLCCGSCSAKSTAAAKAARDINPALKVNALQNRVSPATEDVFHDKFWESLDLVVNALDNVNARLYVDSRCVYFGKPLLESGTLGPKCNTQVVIPNMTENYGMFCFKCLNCICACLRSSCCCRPCAVLAMNSRSNLPCAWVLHNCGASNVSYCVLGASRDPPEKQAPMCTVHSFPHNIDHCLTFARSEFEGHLEKAPAEANAFLLQPSSYIQVLHCICCVVSVLQTVVLSLHERHASQHTAQHQNCMCSMLVQSIPVAQSAARLQSSV